MKKQGHEERGHAPLPPSASKRWLTCHPSQGYIRRLIRDGVITKRASGPAAQRGTRIHEIAEPWLRARLAGKKTYRPPAKCAKDEVAEAGAYVGYCLKKWEDAAALDPKAQCGIEHKSTVTDECWGSCDFWIFAAGIFISIDLKSGREAVDPDGNTQLLIYALGIIKANGFVARKVELCIWQPNDDREMPEKVAVYTKHAFTKAVIDITIGIKGATSYLDEKIASMQAYHARLVPGDHCGYCDALGVCPAAKSRSLSISSANFQPVPVERFSPPAAEKLEPDQIAEILTRAPAFYAWLNSIETRALELMHKGHRIPGYKVVQKVTRRAWESKYTDGQLARALRIPVSKLTKTVRLSPSQVEETLDKAGKAKLAKLLFKPIGDPTVVRESDRRQALPSTKISFTPVSNVEDDDG